MKTPILAIAFAMATAADGALLITGLVDGTEAGGNPKVIEVVSTTDGLELSDFFILRDTNGSSGGSFTVSSTYQFPTGTLDAGEFFYIYGNANSETRLEDLGIGNTDTNADSSSIANQNGDDIFAISTSTSTANIIDAFGLLGQDDTNFYADSVSYRQAGTAANPTGVLDGGNFDITDYSEAVLLANLGSFTVVPEPSAALLGGLGFLILLRRRR